MIRIAYEPDMWGRADRKARDLGAYDRSHRGVLGNQVGFLGEEILGAWLTRKGKRFLDERETTTHDFRYFESSGISGTLDVKTKDRTVIPEGHFDCSVPLYNHEHQRPDIYWFVSLLRDYKFAGPADDIRRYVCAYILGAITRNALEAHGILWKKDQVDPSNGMKFWTDCINVSASSLTMPTHVIAHWL